MGKIRKFILENSFKKERYLLLIMIVIGLVLGIVLGIGFEIMSIPYWILVTVLIDLYVICRVIEEKKEYIRSGKSLLLVFLSDFNWILCVTGIPLSCLFFGVKQILFIIIYLIASIIISKHFEKLLEE